MRKKFVLFLFISSIFYLLVSACAFRQTAVLKQHTISVPVVRLLKQLPVQNQTQQQIWIETLANQPEDSLRKMMSLFTRNDSLLRVQIRFALHGLALNFQRFNEKQQAKFIALFTEALHASQHFLHQQFLIEQIQWTADDRFAPLLIPFYSRAELRQPVLRSLRQLKGPHSDTAVLQLLKTSPDPSLIELCAEHQIKQSISLLKKWAAHEDKSIKQAALLVLARFADPSVLNEAKRDARLSFILARELLARQKNEQAAPLISYWLAKADSLDCSLVSELLNLQYELKPKRALNLALKQYLKRPACRNAILFTSQNWKDSLVVRAFSEILKSSDESAVLQWINWLGQSKNRFALKALLSLFETKNLNPAIRQALLQALNYYAQPSLTKILLNEILSHPQNTSIVLQALARHPKEHFEEPFARILPQAADSVKPALIQFAAQHQLKATWPFVLSNLQSEDFRLQRAVWKASVSLAAKTEIDSLFHLALASPDATSWKAASRALSELIEHQKIQRPMHQLLKKEWTVADATAKIKILELSRRLGGRDFFSFVILAAKASSPMLRKAAEEALLNWPDEAALNDLIVYLKKTKNQRQKILALRQAVRLIQQSGMAAERAFPYLKELLSLATRLNEKKFVVAAMGDFPSFESIQFLSERTNDRHLGQTAFIALQRIFQEKIKDLDEETQEYWLALISGKAAPEVIQSINELRR
ncbi:MAG: hypothetical protein J7L94_16340, partial [Caldisericaceae bacterium]|nr:hypothetical protein [Caldisericaceae bacterium]